ncbi:MAG: DUF4328 domain-containing protein [Fluviicola sp.]|nr:DUF4328 domain-containing protein [Fluviicola sp.]
MNPLKNNENRAKNAISLLWIIFIMYFVLIFSDILQTLMLNDIKSGITVSMEKVQLNNLRQLIVSYLYLAIFIISAITFILWFRRAYYNLHQKVTYLNYSEGWAAGAWFVPVVFLFYPLQIMKELYYETHELLEKNQIQPKAKNNQLIIGFWWALWIIVELLSRYEFIKMRSATTVDDVLFLTNFSIVSTILALVNTVLIIKLVKDYALLESQLYTISKESDNTTAIEENSEAIIE